MNIPNLTGIVDLVALQNAITLILCDEPRLANVPILPEIKLLSESDLQVDVIWQLPRSAFTVTPGGVTVNQQLNSGQPSPVGGGILVEMVEAETESPNTTGPASIWTINVVCFAERNTALTPVTGIGMLDNQMAQIVKDALHWQPIANYGTLRAAQTWMAPAHDWMSIRPGIFATRATMKAVAAPVQTQRSQLVTISISSGICTLTTSDNAADMFYTINDGSMPVKANTNAQNYGNTGPFPVKSGDYILAACRSAGLLLSCISTATAP